MPRCLMAKKWKAYPWPDREEDIITTTTTLETDTVTSDIVERQEPQIQQTVITTVEPDEEEEIDVVGDLPATAADRQQGKSPGTASCWGPSSPTAGATAPSPPPQSPEATRGSTILYNGEYYLPFIYLFYSITFLNVSTVYEYN